MVIAEKSPKGKDLKIAAQQKVKVPKVAAQKKIVERRQSSGDSDNPFSMVKEFVCKYLC